MKSGTKPTQFWITPGATVTEAGREFIILNVVDLNCFFAKDVETGRKVLLTMGPQVDLVVLDRAVCGSV